MSQTGGHQQRHPGQRRRSTACRSTTLQRKCALLSKERQHRMVEPLLTEQGAFCIVIGYSANDCELVVTTISLCLLR